MARGDNIVKLLERIREVASDIEAHTCRDDGYTPYNGACPMCIKQIGLLRQMRSLQENPRSPSHRSTP